MLAIGCVALASLASCRRAAPAGAAADVSMDDPAAFAEFRAFVLAEPAAWAGRAAYNPTDPALVDPELRRVLQLRNRGVLPADREQRRRLAFAFAGSVWAGALSRPDWRAAVEARVAAYWQSPPIERRDGGLVSDLGRCPGPITQWSSGRYGITESVFADRGQLRRDVVADRLLALVAIDRTARFFEIQVEVPVGHRSPERFRYRYDPGGDVLYVILPGQPGSIYVSPAPLHGDLSSLKTTAPTRIEELRHLRVGRDVGPL